MTIQITHSSEFAAAKVALVCMAVPGIFRGPGLPVPFQEVVCDDAIPIALSQGAEDALTVNAACVWARAGFKMI